MAYSPFRSYCLECLAMKIQHSMPLSFDNRETALPMVSPGMKPIGLAEQYHGWHVRFPFEGLVPIWCISQQPRPQFPICIGKTSKTFMSGLYFSNLEKQDHGPIGCLILQIQKGLILKTQPSHQFYRFIVLSG